MASAIHFLQYFNDTCSQSRHTDQALGKGTAVKRAHLDLNQGPTALETAALPTELCTHLILKRRRVGHANFLQHFNGACLQNRLIDQTLGKGTTAKRAPLDSNHSPTALEADALPTELCIRLILKRRGVGNINFLQHFRDTCLHNRPTDQTLGKGTAVKRARLDSNQGPTALQADALPTELCTHLIFKRREADDSSF